MATKVNDFVLHVATANGSGSQSSNNVLVRSLFRMGVPVTGKNLFPSNIQGLPTWFTIRANANGFTSRRTDCDIVVAMNQASAVQDIQSVKPQGYFILTDTIKLTEEQRRKDITIFDVPFKKLADEVSKSAQLKKLLVNMIYVGVVARLLDIDREVMQAVVTDMFKGKATVVESNMNSINVGYKWAEDNLDYKNFPLKAQSVPGGNKNKILIDGNTAGALGWLFGGCTFVGWYPITPSSSLVENFKTYAEKYRKDDKGNNRVAIVQAEDELSSICMVTGAGWAGARAATATSGPGISLMAETVGLSYFAEVPAVIWNVQRGGPSTGLPTRTQQSDVLFTATLSHGDTQHPILFPNDPSECFEFGQVGFDLAERLQTTVFVLTDLDIGMNLWATNEFTYPDKPYDRGKVLSAEDLKKVADYGRYKDVDGDCIPYRTLPGTDHPSAAYVARGTGHDEKANYSESPVVYKKTLDRLKGKYVTAKKYVPAPIIDKQEGAKHGILAFGSTDFAIPEVRFMLTQKGLKTNYLRLRALPFTKEVDEFIERHDKVFVVEQNRDAQMATLLKSEYPAAATKFVSILQYDGMPITPTHVFKEIAAKENMV